MKHHTMSANHKDLPFPFVILYPIGKLLPKENITRELINDSLENERALSLYFPTFSKISLHNKLFVLMKVMIFLIR